MVGYAILSFFGMLLISSVYGFLQKRITLALNDKIMQAWKHRPARFIILLLTAAQCVAGVILYLTSCYLLYRGAMSSSVDEYGYNYSAEGDIALAWAIYGLAIAISFTSDIFRAIFTLTFAD